MYQETPGHPHNLGVAVKRKRGRPRKYPKPDQVLRETAFGLTSEELYSAENDRGFRLRANEMNVNASKSASNVTVGQEVYGVVEAAFGAGYLLAVKVGDSETTFRGVVFKPGNFIPVSEQNDVVPDIEMIRRSEVPFPTRKTEQYLNVSRGATEPQRSKPVCAALPSGLQLNNPQTGLTSLNQASETCHTLNGTLSSYQNPLMTSESQMLWTQPQSRHRPAWVGPSNPTSAQVWRESEAHVTRKHGRPFEKLLSEVIKSIEPPAGSAQAETCRFATRGSAPGLEDEEEPLTVEPLRSVGLNKSAFMFKPVKDCRPGKMTHLLQAVQENMREPKGFFDSVNSISTKYGD